MIGPELFGAASLDGDDEVGTPLELQLGAHYAASPRVRVGAAVGLGVVNAVGEPNARVLASLRWTP